MIKKNSGVLLNIAAFSIERFMKYQLLALAVSASSVRRIKVVSIDCQLIAHLSCSLIYCLYIFQLSYLRPALRSSEYSKFLGLSLAAMRLSLMIFIRKTVTFIGLTELLSWIHSFSNSFHAFSWGLSDSWFTFFFLLHQHCVILIQWQELVENGTTLFQNTQSQNW